MAALPSQRLFRTLLTLFVFAMLPTNGFAASLNTQARYVVTLRGVNIAEVGVNFKDDGQNYTANIDGDVSGLASLVSAGTAKLTSSGTSNGKQLQSNQFLLETKTSTDTFTVRFQANNANVTSTQVVPPLSQNQNRVPVVSKHRRKINDPIAAFLVKADTLNPDVCNRSFKVYTGVERYDLDLKFAEKQTATSKRTGYQGPVMLCTMRYKPISGHFTNSDTTNYMKSNQRFLIWYAPLGQSGYMIPYRVLVGTAFGDLSMVLTRLNY
ncbi:DUF3108 domain-containing protein [Maritalea sp.]|uniref:DUF3108 domain-containing protein n=1 Tax=Maritalea sp. TaxID=2003361 RepID=UPI003EF4FD97